MKQFLYRLQATNAKTSYEILKDLQNQSKRLNHERRQVILDLQYAEDTGQTQKKFQDERDHIDQQLMLIQEKIDFIYDPRDSSYTDEDRLQIKEYKEALKRWGDPNSKNRPRTDPSTQVQYERARQLLNNPY